MANVKLRNTIIGCVIFIIVVAVILLVIFLGGNEDDDNFTVRTSSGDIRGTLAEDGEYLMFLGIPYAEINKSNPFSLSIPYPKFQTVFEAVQDSAVCPQIDNVFVQGVKTFDCLNLNIFTPLRTDEDKLLPVMAFLFGGSFRVGSNNRYLYGPKFIVKHDVILVTISYRVGIYGFMCLDIPEVPGNQGLKDQVLALKWIKKHIKAFGGDDENITIFGNSAGARSVDLHLVSDGEKLFNKLILQSGNSLSPPGVANPDNTLPINVANHLGLQTTNLNEALNFLYSADPKLVSTATSELGYTIFRACVENQFDNVENFINKHPLVKAVAKIKDTPVLIGYTDNERLETYSNQSVEFYELTDLIRTSLVNFFNFDTETLNKMENIVQRLYLGDRPITEETKQDIINFDSDFMYLHPTQRRIQDYINGGASNIYHYKFSFDSKRNFAKHLLNVLDPGAIHTDELSYLFDISYMKDIMSTEEKLTVDRLTTMWTNFAKYGNPTPETTELLPVKWEPVTPEVLNYYNIGADLELGNRPFNRRLSFWDLFFVKNGHLQKGFGEEF